MQGLAVNARLDINQPESKVSRLRIEEYIESLPAEILSGEQAELGEGSLNDIFDLAELGEDDVFYHLGCGDGLGVRLALERGARKAVGVDLDRRKVEAAEKARRDGASYLCADVRDASLDDATVVLFWFADEEIVDGMMPVFERLREGCRVVTLWSPLPGCMPERVEFPYIVSRVPFERASGLREQLLAVFGVRCIDFVTAWEHSERYAKAIGAKSNRFLTILQTVTMWINAKNMGIACGDDMPESIRTYIGILRTYFDIEVGHLLEQKSGSG